MVKNYLIVVGIIWLILHSALSWGMSDAWIGIVVLGQSVAFALLNRGNEAVAGASFAPLTAMSLWGGVDETVMRVFFRCLSEGDAHGLAVRFCWPVLLFPFLSASSVVKTLSS